MADPVAAFSLLSGATQLQDLDDEMVKLVAYNIVCLEYGRECVVEDGQGTTIIAEPMTRERFIGYIIARWLNGLEEATREKYLDFDHSMLDVYFIVSKRWPRRNPKFDEREIKALEGLSSKLNPDQP